jgi:hypothetical protein
VVGRRLAGLFHCGHREPRRHLANFLPDGEEDGEEAIHQALLHDGAKAFFMLHKPTADDQFLSIDGKRRQSENLNIYLLNIYLEDDYGFLVEAEGNEISLQPALYDGSNGLPSLLL